MRKLVFADTNKIFGLFVRYLGGLSLDHSLLIRFARSDGLYISSYVIAELIANCNHEGLDISDIMIDDFIGLCGFHFIISKQLDRSYIEYVQDINDAQILQDCIQSGSIYLLTNNMKDFDQQSINSTFGVQIITSLP